MKLLQKNRAAGCTYLKDYLAEGIADRFLDIKREFPKILEFSAGSFGLIQIWPFTQIYG